MIKSIFGKDGRVFEVESCIDIVFCSHHSINLPDWDFEAQSLQLRANCFRPTTSLSTLNTHRLPYAVQDSL